MKTNLVEHYFKTINKASMIKNEAKRNANLEAISKSIDEDTELKDYEAILLQFYLRNTDK